MMANIALIGTTATAAIQFRGDVIEVLTTQGHQVFVFCNDFTDATKTKIAALGGTPIDSPLSRSSNNPIADIAAMFKLKTLFKSHNIDCVLSYFAKPIVFGTLAAKLAGIENRYAMLEGLGWAFTDRPLGEEIGFSILKTIQLMLYRIALPCAKAVIFLSDDDPKTLEAQGITFKNQTILGAIGVPKTFLTRSKIPTSPMTFIFVGRLLFDKGIREFIAAARSIKTKHPDTVFEIYGDIDTGNPRSLTQDDVEEMKAEKTITLKGYTEDISAALKAATCLVLPSYREGFPRTVQEAMAMGRAVIVSDVPGCRQAVEHGKTGFIVPPFSSKALAKQMEDCIKNAASLDATGTAAHEHAKQNFDGKKQAEKLAEIIT